MKKAMAILLSLVILLAFTACGGNAGEAAQQPTEPGAGSQTTESFGAEPPEEENNILIAYFGRWGNTEFPDDIDASASASVEMQIDIAGGA